MARHRGRRATSGHRRCGPVALTLLVTALLGVPAPGAAAGDPAGGSQLPGPAAGSAALPGPVKPGFSKVVAASAILQPPVAASGRHPVFVEIAARGAAAVWTAAVAKNQDPAAAQRAAMAARTVIESISESVSADATSVDPAAVTIFRVSNAVPGLGLIADAAALRALSNRRDVVRISEIVPKTTANAGAAQLTRALQTWTDLGVTGRGIRIGVIDTGIDYTHADFGGPGTPAAYRAAGAAGALPWQPTQKVVGGFDFVGDNYDAAAHLDNGTTDPKNPGYQPIPHPDSNPLDCNGHGTHIAGTIAGDGVGADGHTFTGDYAALRGADLYGMAVGPGMAPQASLYAFKVFGCAGSTDAVIPALDRSLDPNGDGEFSDRLDVVDLAMSSTAASVQDPETAVLDAIAQFGVLPVVAVGNDGDETDAASSLAGSVQSLAVASSTDAYQQLDGLGVTMPGRPAGTVAGQVSLAYPWTQSADVTGQVVSLSVDNVDGCAPLSPADAAKVAGKVVWLIWDGDDATRVCGSAVRAADVRAAGAVGALLTSGTPVFTAAVTGVPGLPVFQLTPDATSSLQPTVDSGLQVRFSGSLIGKKPEVDDSITDLVGAWSARGPRGVLGLVKPDVAAPGDTISSAQMGSGNGSALRSGTSMAAADVAGIAALVRQSRPAWSPEEVKAAVMNTADHDVYAAVDKSGPVLGPDRVGAGRVDARAAVATQVLAYSSTTPGAVSVSFGVVPADVRQPAVIATAAVVVRNTGPTTAELNLSYQAVVDQPGVAYAVSPAGMELTAGASALATVTMTITPTDLRHTLDPATPAQQTNPLTGLDEARQYVSAASGRVVLSSSGAGDLRVPVYGAAKPVSSTAAVDGTFAGHPAVVLSGTGFSLSAPADPASTAYNSMVSVLDLGYRSTRIPPCSEPNASAVAPASAATGVRSPLAAIPPVNAGSGAPGPAVMVGGTCSSAADAAGDLQAVGAGRAVPAGSGAGYLWFGLSTYGDWTTAGRSTFPTVNIDTNGDNTADYTVQVQMVGGDSDLLYALLFDDRTGSLIGIYPVNFNPGNVDTGVFDTNVLLVPIDPTAIGYRSTMRTFPIRYSIATYSAHGAPQNSGTVDTTPAIEFDVAQPKVTTSGPLWQDQGGTGIAYRLAPGLSSADALVLHLGGATGRREQIVRLSGGSG